jgi:pimeloyl-ACP methyl ester carboxylesterase
MFAKRFSRSKVRPPQESSFPVSAVPLAVTTLLLGLCCTPAAAPEKAGGDTEKLPKPKEMVLLTNDGLRLAATYYPSAKGKDTVPVILLHMYKGSGSDYAGLASLLQQLGHAVLVPDLRGHGGSTQFQGTQVPLSAENMSRTDFTRMVTSDMEALKDFLREENNGGHLNIEKLCLVGAEMGASVALTWTQLDWSRPPVGVYKLGQDVKALVLISPEWSTPGLPLKPVLTRSNARFPLTDPLLINAAKKGIIAFKYPYEMDMRREVSVMIVAGKGNSRVVRDAQRLLSMLERYHPEPPPKDREKELDLFYGWLDTSLQGTKMLGASGLGLDELIANFIKQRLVDRPFPWQPRTKDPHVQGKRTSAVG